MSKNKAFIFFVISFFIGIFFGNFLFNLKIILIFLCITLMFLFLLLLVIKKHHFFVLIITLGLFFGLMYSSVNNYFISNNLSKIQNYYDKKVEIQAENIENYNKTDTTNSYIFKIISIDSKKDFNFNFLLYTNKSLVLKKGQIIKLNSKIDKIDNFDESFNYEKYMQSKNVYFSIYSTKIDILGINNSSFIVQKIDNFRQKFLNIINEIYPKNEAIFLAGILIGAKENLDKNILENFNKSGLTHIIAVSGFNITIIIIFLGFLLSKLPIIIRTIIITLFIIFFVILVGENVAAIRAAIMGLIGYYILVLGRKGDSLSILLFTAFIMILFNPLYLNYDISFHLSFLAVIGLLYFQNFWNKIFSFLPSFLAIKESFVLTLSALTTTIPIMIFNFGQVSILAPIANMLVGGLVPFTMLLGFLSIIGHLISDKISFIIGFLDYFLLKFIINVAELFGSLNFALLKFDFSIYSIYLEIIYFLTLIFLIIYFKQEKSPKL